ncbi:tRNA (adenosine(37)-N6)-dimethylallyltransferase MiaA [Aquimixticola soesokkakensis]|nr:tRNA (adenosine(37)-N6)-dimethylallyltransferase MiaA [Aquimixticola soesokkakensis]
MPDGLANAKDRPVLIAGPTASGKSALALEIAQREGGVIVNADALQVFGNWRVLTARPSKDEESRVPHRLYGHLAGDCAYSVGHWLREVDDILSDWRAGGPRPIITGGTGLYFTALTQGLAQIPPTPPALRAEADARVARDGFEGLLAELDARDPTSAQALDRQNPMRVQRAWEVLQATGRGIAAWRADTPAPLLALDQVTPLVLDAERDWLAERIDRRFDLMLAGGALDEARANLANWTPAAPSAKAIGAPELIAYLRGEIDLNTARQRAQAASRQYAKRQRTWFRSKMADWHRISLPETD